MSKYSTIAVIYGGDSSEWEVSCRGGEFVASRIDEDKYDVYQIVARFGKWELVAYRKKNSMRVAFPESARPIVDKTDFSVNVLGEKVKFDFAYIMIHGAPGETGELQGYLEMLKVPFSSCSSFSSAVAFDKYACKSFIRNLGIVKCAPDVFVREGSQTEAGALEAAAKLKFPLFVKPTRAGSSFGITRVTEAGQLPQAIKFAFSESKTVIVEQGVSGRELTCATYFDGEKISTLPLIEIVSENEYFDYDAKYNGHSREICPAPVDAKVSEEVSETSKRIYDSLGCSGVVRIDYIYSETEGLHLIEINTIPGMTSASLVPKMVRTAGLDITEFLSTIIENA